MRVVAIKGIAIKIIKECTGTGDSVHNTYHCAMLNDERFDDVVAVILAAIVVLYLLYKRNVHVPLSDCRQLMLLLQYLRLRTLFPAVKSNIKE